MSEELRPGRNCPISYRYPPASMRRDPQIEAEAIYIVGGLYGNVEALDSVREMAASERDAVLAFNGDFHWFDVAHADYLAVNATVLARPAIRGNVETELAAEESGAGCGCAYPADVSDAEVSRSNSILERLRETVAQTEPEGRAADDRPVFAGQAPSLLPIITRQDQKSKRRVQRTFLELLPELIGQRRFFGSVPP